MTSGDPILVPWCKFLNQKIDKNGDRFMIGCFTSGVC